MKKIMITTEKPFAPAAVQQMKQLVMDSGFEFGLLEKYTSEEELLKVVPDAHALIIRSDKINANVIAASSNLEIVVRAGAGYDNVDLSTATDNNIVVMNTPGQNSNAVAELALGMMVFHARSFFSGKAGSELKGKSIGIHAFGYVGNAVATIAKGFGMNVFAFDPFVEDDKIKQAGVTPVASAEELYQKCQYISLHIPANDKTKKSIDKNLMMMMPKGATIINTARKEVVCEESLMAVLGERDDFSYLSDIAPDNKEEIISKYEGRCYFSPKKLGAQTKEANANAGIAATNQIINFFKNGDTTFKVN